MQKPTEDTVQALACAIAVLEGTAGGYNATEKMNAKMELMKMLQAAEIELEPKRTAVSEDNHESGPAKK